MMGAIVHTLNLRLHADELGYIARHAGDTLILVDRSLLPLLEQFVAGVPTVRHVIVIPDDGPTAEGQLDYEKLHAGEAAEYDWPRLDENTACTLCYTSGTTGNPKGVIYSHRSSVLHALLSCLSDAVPVAQRDVLMPVVPMFHANAWGYPHMACTAATGAAMVFPETEALLGGGGGGGGKSRGSLLDLHVAEEGADHGRRGCPRSGWGSWRSSTRTPGAGICRACAR